MAGTATATDPLLYKLDTTFHETHLIHKQGQGSEAAAWILGKWTSVKIIGEGGQGTVSLETRMEPYGERAVKRIDKRLMKALGIDIKRELLALIAVRGHEELFVTFFGWYEDSEFIYFAMEYMPHGDLRQYLKERGSEASKEARSITKQLLKGLAVLHQNEICHRDLKPQNVLVAWLSPIQVKLVDFGISKCTKGTELRTKFGNNSYMAPELALGLSLLPREMRSGSRPQFTYTKAIDLWALGFLVYEILTLEIPFQDPLVETEMSGVTCATAQPSLDAKLLLEFCRGEKPLPVESLQRCNASESATQFIKALLVADPKSRMSAVEGLKHTWIVNGGVGDSSQVVESSKTKVAGAGQPQFEASSPVSSQGSALPLITTGDQQNMNRLQQQPQRQDTLCLTTATQPVVTIDNQSQGLQLDPVSPKIVTSIFCATGEQTCEQRPYQQSYVSSPHMVSHQSTLTTTNQSQSLPITPLSPQPPAPLINEADGQAGEPNRLQRTPDPSYFHSLPYRLLARRSTSSLVDSRTRQEMHMALFSLQASVSAHRRSKSLNFNIGGTSAICIAAHTGNIKRVTELIKEKADVEGTDERQRTPLIIAAAHGYFALVKLLLDEGAEKEARSISGGTALHYAAWCGHTATSMLLLDEGAYKQPTNAAGETPLHHAARQGHDAIVKLLLERGAGTQTRCKSRRTPLHYAASGGYTKSVEFLLDYGSSQQAKDKNGETPLHAAAHIGHEETVRLLLRRGAEKDETCSMNRTALHLAARTGHQETVKVLLAGGANIEARSQGNKTALHDAARNGHRGIVRLLLERGANPQARSESLCTPLHYAALGGHETTVEELLDHGVSTEVISHANNTPLHYAAWGGHKETVQLLLDREAEIEPCNDFAQTPLHYAAQCGHKDTVELLLDYGADKDRRYGLQPTPLHLAVRQGQLPVVRLLLERGANPGIWAVPDGSAFNDARLSSRRSMSRLLKDWQMLRSGGNSTD